MDQEQVIHVLNDPLGQDLLNTNSLARLAYLGRRWLSTGDPDWVLLEWCSDHRLYWRTTAPKVRALGRNPKVALTIDTDTQPPHVLLVRGTAQIEVIEGVAFEYLAASKKGIPEQQWNSFEAQVRTMYKQMARIAITPEWAKLFDFETRLPDFLEQLAGGKSDP